MTLKITDSAAEAIALLQFVNGDLARPRAAHSTEDRRFDDLLGALVRGAWLGAAAAGDAANATTGESEARILHEAARIRSILREILNAVADGSDLTPLQIDTLNEVVARRRGDVFLGDAPRGLTWRVVAPDPVEEALSKVTWSAVELLTDPERTVRLRRCEGCGVLLVDFTKNGSRRWCEMGVCGNRAKARRYYQRKRSLGSPVHPGSQADGVP